MKTVLIYSYILFLETKVQSSFRVGIRITYCHIGFHMLYVLYKTCDCNCVLNTKVSSKIKTVVVRMPFVLHVKT
jgi:hypothetical protein